MYTALSSSGLFLLLCGYFGTSRPTAVTMLAAGVGSVGLLLSGAVANMIDIAPRFSGVLMAIVNSIATVPGIIGPQIAEAIVDSVSEPKFH